MEDTRYFVVYSYEENNGNGPEVVDASQTPAETLEKAKILLKTMFEESSKEEKENSPFFKSTESSDDGLYARLVWNDQTYGHYYITEKRQNGTYTIVS